MSSKRRIITVDVDTDPNAKNKSALSNLRKSFPTSPTDLKFGCNSKTMVVILLCLIIVLSLYYSMLMLDESSNNRGNPHINILKPNIPKEMNQFIDASAKDTQTKIDKQIKKQNIDNLNFKSSFDNFDPQNGNEHINTIEDLKIAIKLSLNGYILRSRHDRRVEYMIGTREKINNISSLSSRPAKEYVNKKL